MKESKFIELLNLYIDQQISPEDARLLEEEILQDPRRRRIYNQYCKMHRACTLVFENFRAQAQPAAGGVGQVANSVVEFQPPRRVGWAYSAAGLAAACVAVAVVGTRLYLRQSAPAALGAGTAVTEIMPSPVRTAPTTGVVRLDATSPRPAATGAGVVANLHLSRMPLPAQPASVSFVSVSAAASRSYLPAAQGAPGTSRPSIEQFVFEEPDAATEVPVLLRYRQPADSQIARTAYQFQR